MGDGQMVLCCMKRDFCKTRLGGLLSRKKAKALVYHKAAFFWPRLVSIAESKLCNAYFSNDFPIIGIVWVVLN